MFNLFQAPQITLSAPQRQIFEELKKGTRVTQHLAKRASLILLAAEGEKNLRIAQTTGLTRNTVKAWRQRWAARVSRLNQIEANQPRALRAAIGVALEDAPRSGHPGKTTNIQLALILQMACESPEKYDVPLSHWTAAALARTAIQRGFVERISARQVGRYLAQADLKPHWSRYGSNPDMDDPQAFEANVRKVCPLCADAPQCAQVGVEVHSTDEMTRMKAREHTQRALPMRSGKPEALEFEYARQGTSGMIASRNGVTGQIEAPWSQPTRTEVDLRQPIRNVVDRNPAAKHICA